MGQAGQPCGSASARLELPGGLLLRVCLAAGRRLDPGWPRSPRARRQPSSAARRGTGPSRTATLRTSTRWPKTCVGPSLSFSVWAGAPLVKRLAVCALRAGLGGAPDGQREAGPVRNACHRCPTLCCLAALLLRPLAALSAALVTPMLWLLCRAAPGPTAFPCCLHQGFFKLPLPPVPPCLPAGRCVCVGRGGPHRRTPAERQGQAV